MRNPLLYLPCLGLALTVVAGSLRADEQSTCPSCPPTAALSLETTYSGELWRQASGGIRTGGRYLDNLDIGVRADAEQLFGLNGLTLFGNLLYNNGQGFADELVGSAQGVSNIETVQATRLYELWGEWRLGSQHSLRAGLYDLNSEFDSIEPAGLFIQPSQGIGADLAQTGENGPSIFPVTALAARIKHSSGPWSLQAAVLDAVPGDPQHPRRTRIKLAKDEGALLVAQASRQFAGLRVSGGYWRYTARFADLESKVARTDNTGAYLSVVSPRLLIGAAGNGLDMYVRAGRAQAHINPIDQYFGAAVVYNGLFADDGSDQLGLSVAVAQLGAPFRRQQAEADIPTAQRESVWELTYRVNLTDWLAVQPDVQYIRHPGMNPQLRDSWVVGLRFEVSRAWER